MSSPTKSSFGMTQTTVLVIVLTILSVKTTEYNSVVIVIPKDGLGVEEII